MSKADSSLLAHLAARLTSRTEVLATEALGYILSQSSVSREAVRTALDGSVPSGLPPLTAVQTEVVGENNERVDLVAFDENEGERVLIEAKFWAGLTDNQPNTYLARLLQADGPAVLLFVAPEARQETLWRELLRIGRREFHLDEVSDRADRIRSASVRACTASSVADCGHRLALSSWRSVLDTTRAAVGVGGDAATERDILQLIALCERQDAAAFLPLRQEEFAPEIPRRLLNLGKLIDDAVQQACAEGIADTTSLKATPLATGYGRYMRIGGDKHWAQARFCVNYSWWAHEQETPLWFTLLDSTDMPLAEAEGRLGYSWFGFDLPVGVEYDAVLASVMDDLRDVARRIADDYGT